MIDYDGASLFNKGWELQQQQLQSRLKQEEAERSQRTQDNLEKQRLLQAAQSEQRSQQQIARDQASNQYRDMSLERQQQRDFVGEQARNQQLNSEIFGDYIEDYVGSYQKRLDSLGKEYDQLAQKLLPVDQAAQAKAHMEEQYYTNVVAPSLAKVGNIADLTAALNQVSAKKPFENVEHVKAIIAPAWEQLQSQGIRDPETIQRVLTKVLQDDVASRNPARNNEAIQKRMAEMDAERQRLNGLLQGSGMYNKLMSPQEYMAMRRGPMAMGQTTDPTQLSPPQANKKQHYATGMAMIGNYKDGKPVHINPQSWGGTVTSEDGRVQIVPSVHATVSDALQIERLNQTGAKILSQPVIEDDIDVPMTAPKAPPQKKANINQELATQNTKQEQEAIKQITAKIDSDLSGVAGQFGAALAQFKENPSASELTYDQIMGALQKVAEQIASRPEAAYLNITPEVAYQKLLEKLPEFGIKPLAKREKNTKDNLQYNEHSLQDTINLGENFRDFELRKLRALRGAKSNQLSEEVLSNPWVRGTWAVPNSYNDLIEYQRRLQALQQGQQQ